MWRRPRAGFLVNWNRFCFPLIRRLRTRRSRELRVQQVRSREGHFGGPLSVENAAAQNEMHLTASASPPIKQTTFVIMRAQRFLFRGADLSTTGHYSTTAQKKHCVVKTCVPRRADFFRDFFTNSYHSYYI